MAKLNQMIAVRKGLNARVDRAVTDVYHQFQKAALFQGITRVYTPRNDDGEQLPPESQTVQRSVEQGLQTTADELNNLWDAVATVDYANTVAKADVVLATDDDVVVLVRAAPVPFLLFLRKQLEDLRTQLGKAPTLDPTVRWSASQYGALLGQHETEPVTTLRTTKVVEPVVAYPATDKHPAQVQMVSKDVVAGEWSTVRLSTSLPESRRRAILSRISDVLDAVNMAVESANDREVEQVQVGEGILDFILDN